LALGLALALGLGQLSTGLIALGQAAIAIFFGLGQLATGYIAVGQFAFGKYVLVQMVEETFEQNCWSTRGKNKILIYLFTSVLSFGIGLDLMRDIP